MSGSPVDTLKVDLDMDPTGFKAGTDQGISALDKLAAKIGLTAGVASAAGTLIGQAIGGGLRYVINQVEAAISHIDDLNDASMRVGTSVENFTALEYVARLTGTSIGSVEQALKLLSNAMDDMANNKATTATKAISDLGISLKDANGKLRDSHDVLLDIAEKFEGMKDGAAKTALAIDIFGKSGAQMVQMLNQGKVGIKQMEDAARAMGFVVGKQAADEVNNFKDQIDILKMRMEALWRMIGTTFIPIFNELYENFIRVAVGLAGLIGETVAAKNYLVNLWDDPTHAAEKYTAEVTKMRAQFAKLVQDTERGFTLPAPPREVQTDVPTGNRTQAIKDETAAKAAQIPIEQAFFQEMKAQSELRQFDLKMGELEAAQYKKISEAKDISIQQEMVLGQLLRDKAITLQQYNDAIIGVTSTMNDAFGQATDHIISNLRRIQTFFANVSNGSAEQWLAMGDAMVDTLQTVFGQSKAFAIAATIINTAQAVMKTLAEFGGGPWAWAAAAAVAAMGAAQIAKIMSTSEKGSGGGATVPVHGAGGAPAGGGGAQGPQQTLFVQGIDPNHMYSGDAVRNLAESLLQYQRDGGRVVLAGAA